MYGKITLSLMDYHLVPFKKSHCMKFSSSFQFCPFGSSTPWTANNKATFKLILTSSYSYSKCWLKISFNILTKQPILLSSKFGQNETKELHLVSSETCEHMSSYTCQHVLAIRASTCFLHMRARYLFVRARLLFKNVRPGHSLTVSQPSKLR